MSAILRQLLTLTVAAVVSWWFFLGFERPEPAPAVPTPAPLPVVLTPVPLEESAPRAEAPQPATPAPREVPEEREALDELADLDLPDSPEPEPEASAPPPSELGDPEGEGELAAEQSTSAAETDEQDAEGREGEPASVSAEDAMASDELLEAARAELSGEVRTGFATVLLAAPEEQLDVARFFGEEIVLVPKSALQAETDQGRYFRLALSPTPRVESVRGTDALQRYRQYRDLFDYEYARLPEPLRELRRSVLSRTEVYLFGALIPEREWAVVVQRRREALAQSGRPKDEVRRFVLQYRSRPQGGFDLRVESIAFADGSQFRPPQPDLD